jgi:uncharacterized membrane protein YgdD (TMEM256/DUF423 family)
MNRARSLIAVAAGLGALGIAAGAFGAHALSSRLTPERLGWFETAARYHLVHAAALLALGTLAGLGWRVRLAAGLLIGGVLVFSGTLYAMALGAPRWLGAITPLGGAALVLGWLALAAAKPAAERT